MLKYKKQTAIMLLLMICLSLAMPLTACASISDKIDEVGDKVVDKIKDVIDIGNPLEKAVASLVGFINRMCVNLWDKVGFKSILDLVFADGLSEAEKQALPWQPGQLEPINKFYKGLMIAIMPIYVLLIGISAYKYLSAAVNPKERAEAKDSVMRLFYGIILMLLAPYIIEILMAASLFLTDVIALAFNNIKNVQDLSCLSVGLLSSDSIRTGSTFGTIIIKTCFALAFIYFNFLYIMRMFAISVMYIFTPIASIAWVVNKNTTAIQVWFGELITNAFMPVSHALVLCVLLLLSDVKNVTEGSFVFVLIMLWGVISLSEVIRKSMESIVSRIASYDADGATKGIFGKAAGIGSVMRVGHSTFSKAGNAGRIGKSNPVIPKPANKVGNQPLPSRERRTVRTYGSVDNQAQSLQGMYQDKSIVVPKSSGGSTQGTARVYNTPSRNATVTKIPTIGTADKIGGIAGAATKIASLPVILGAGAIPGGQQIVQGGTKVVEGATRKATTAVVAGGQIARAYAQTRNMGKSLQKVTGTANKKEALGRIMNPNKATSYEAAKKFKTARHGGNYRVKEIQAVKKQTTPKSQQKQSQSGSWRNNPISEKQEAILRKMGKSSDNMGAHRTYGLGYKWIP